MKSIPSLNLGFSDAENYKRRENKDFLNRVFIKNQALDKLCSKETFFLIGEKGTGKTAYSVFLENNNYANTKAKVFYIRETEYQAFVALKNEKQLLLSDYVNIWKVIIFVLLGQTLAENDVISGWISRFAKLASLKKAVETYYQSAFAPEIVYALNFVKESKVAAELISKAAKAGGEENESLSFSESRFQANLLYIERQFRDAISILKLSQNHIIFIDGIDIRPASIPFDEYLACIKGLANAVWSLNNDFFPAVKDTPGRSKIVLLIRPDIFAELGLQNQNAKIRDNSVLLDWRTTYHSYRTSGLFVMADKLLGSQQEEIQQAGDYWDYYFPYKVQNYRTSEQTDSSFIPFLRYSLYRPRDIVTMLGILRELFTERQRNEDEVFRSDDFDSADFRSRYADYLLGEIKDHLAFYYSDLDYEVFLKFFEFLKGKNAFDYKEYVEAFEDFETFTKQNSKGIPAFCGSPDSFLQFLYELNILSFSEQTGSELFHHFCFRERTYSNISPKVKTHERYEIHYGLAKAVNTGRRIISRRSR
jgi:hypothetical protein